MQDLNFEADPQFPAFIALLNGMRKNDISAVRSAIPNVQKMENSGAAFGVGLLNGPAHIDPTIVAELAPLALIARNSFDAVNYLGSRAAVRFAEQNHVAALKVYLPHLAQFKSDNDLELEEDVYLEVAVEEQYPELLRFVVERQTQQNNFGGLGMVQTAMFARKNNDFWALEELHTLSKEMAFPASDWGLVALALYEEGTTKWAEEIVKRHQGEAGFDDVIQQQDRQASTEALNDMRTMVNNYRIKQELQKLQEEVQAARNDKKL